MRLAPAFFRHRSKPNDFARMGRGIEDRYSRCQKWWEPHLACSRDFIQAHLPHSACIGVFGAGRLLDLDLGLLLERCETVHLYDADAASVVWWQRAAGTLYGKRVIGHVEDCTDTIEAWSAALRRYSAKHDLSDFLMACRAPVPAWSHNSFDGIISLNLLGQIPLFWRDRVLEVKPELSESEWGALSCSMAELQQRHLKGVLTQPQAWSILITDTEYYFYHSDKSMWRVEPALFGTVPQVLLESFVPRGTSDTWLWHLAPQYIECDEEGEIHRVEAFFRSPVQSANTIKDR
jgi:hypothetical protein